MTKEESSKHKYLLATLVYLIIPISGVGIDIYIPSLPAISQHFGIHKSLAQLTITFYMLGLGIVQLFAGGLSDSFGRKKPFIFSLFIFIIAVLLVPFSKNITQLLILRLIQGSAVALTIVPMRAVISDLFEGRELRKMINYMTMAWSIGPIIAPAIGGYLQYYFGWTATFYFLALYTAILFIFSIFYFTETSVYRYPFSLTTMVQHYKDILSNGSFITGLSINGLTYAIAILFSIVGPFLIQDNLHYSSIQFGYIALLLGAGWFLGTMTNHFLIDVLPSLKVQIFLWILLCISLMMYVGTLFIPINIYNVVIPIFALYLFAAAIYPNYFLHCVALFPKISGSTSALFGSSVFLVSCVASAFGTCLKSTSVRPLVGTYIVLSVVCLIFYYWDEKKNGSPISKTQ